MTLALSFTVHDTPRPQGSKRHVGKGIMVESGGQPLRSWREAVKQAALDNLPKGHVPFDGPVSVDVTFYLARPRSHYRTGSKAALRRHDAPQFPHRLPDVDKLLRSCLDALTAAGVWTDDARVVNVLAMKRYCGLKMTTPGAQVVIHEAM
jgi:crossover junction endodeoxyribonuclease RusA